MTRERAEMRSRIFIRQSVYPVEAAAVDEILDELAPSLEGRTVLVKPNCLMAAGPDAGITTHPSLVRALVVSLARRGARVWVGDNPGARGYGAGKACFRRTGMLEAAGEAFVDFGRSTTKVGIKSRFVDQVVVSRHVLEADYVLSVPKLKTHCLTLLTGAVKNMYGVLAGGEKVKLHSVARGREDFAEAVVDVYSIRPPDLALMDAVVAMEGDGPSRGSLRQVGKIVAADNAVAADVAAARLMGVSSSRVGHLVVAADRGFGPLELKDAAVNGDLEPVPGFMMPSTFRVGLMNFLSNRVVFNLLHRSRIEVEQAECISCGECRAACQSGAMVEEDGCFRIQSELCHQCFCCHELCPEGAVKVRGALGALLQRQKV